MRANWIQLSFRGPQEVEEVRDRGRATRPLKCCQCSCDRNWPTPNQSVWRDEHACMRTPLSCELVGQPPKVVPIAGNKAPSIDRGLFQVSLVRPLSATQLLCTNGVYC